MFSKCAGKCYMCYWGEGGCLAGHGDDEYSPATEQQLLTRLVQSRFGQDHDKIRAELVERNPQRYAEPTNGSRKLPDEYTREMIARTKLPLIGLHTEMRRHEG